MLSPRLLEFIHGCVRSVWAVELLLVLRRDRKVAWSPDDLVRELRGSKGLVAEILKWLVAGGVAQLRSPSEFVYEPASALIDELCAELEREYRQRPLAVINAIMSSKNNSVQGLADAFRFREKDK